MELKEAREAIRQDEEARIKKTIEAMEAANKENNTDTYMVFEISMFGQSVTIDSRLLPQDKAKLMVISK